MITVIPSGWSTRAAVVVREIESSRLSAFLDPGKYMNDMATRSYHAHDVQSIGHGAVDGVAKTGFRAPAVCSLVYSCDAGRRQNSAFHLAVS